MGELDDVPDITEDELRELTAWDSTEPGLQQKLGRRRAQMVRLAELNAPAIILANQVRIIGETEADLRGVPREDVTRELVKAIGERYEDDLAGRGRGAGRPGRLLGLRHRERARLGRLAGRLSGRRGR